MYLSPIYSTMCPIKRSLKAEYEKKELEEIAYCRAAYFRMLRKK